LAIVDAFTLTSAIAMVGLLWIERELVLNWLAVRRRKSNGLPLEVSWMLVLLITVITTTNSLFLIVGLGALFKVRLIGYLLAVIPLIKLAGAALVLRSLRQQGRIFRAGSK
jgi:hypothetical protein